MPHPARSVTGALLAMTLAPLLPGAPLPASFTTRDGVSLDGPWHVIVDPYDTGFFNYRHEPFDEHPNAAKAFFLDRHPASPAELIEYDFDRAPTLSVPGDWNSQDDRLFYYEGSVWYRRTFDRPALRAGERLFLEFGAVNYEADVYLNGGKLGRHVGGFTPFAFEITSAVKPSGNSLVVRVNNQRHADGVPTLNTDWWNYGGITRDVRLVRTPATFIASFQLQLRRGTAGNYEARVRLDGPERAQALHLTIAGTPVDIAARTDADGTAVFTFDAPGLDRWSPEHPRLYDVTLAAATDRITDRMGFRTIETRGADILLNGHSIFLRGISLHEENPLRGGRAWSEADAHLLLGWAKELGCNFVRLAHYPHNEHMARVADELGLMLWEEIPVYWTIHWEDPATLANARAQLTGLIARDFNRPSVIVWSVANETPVGDARTAFLRNLVDTARQLDPTRLVSAAMEVRGDPADPHHKIVDDPFSGHTDLLSFNEYVGWYDGQPEDIAKLRWTLVPDKPVFISEFGAGAKQGLHGDIHTRFSEEQQAEIYRRTLAMLEQIPAWRGASPWILCDFRSPRRMLTGVQDGWNRKGLISSEGVRKQAFTVLQQFYTAKAAATDRSAP